jgi:serine/threonine protein phosphatase 1
LATYAIGDIHGRLDFLRELVALVLPLTPADRLVFIGDYVDRGPDSRGVIDFLLDLQTRRDCVFLRGNHEDMFMSWLGLKAVGPPVAPSAWLKLHGGRAALSSYGVETSGLGALWRVGRMKGRPEWLPDGHAAFLEATRLVYEDQDAYYVHAGFRPGIPIPDQSPADLLSIRQGWVDETFALDKIVIHGHTPTPYDGGELKVRILPHRINVDTGSGRHPKGFLSAYRVSDGAVFSAGEQGGYERVMG